MKLLTLLREFERLGIPVKQLTAKVAFQLRDTAADGGLGDVHLVGCQRKSS